MGQDHRSATFEKYVVGCLEEGSNKSSGALAREAGISQSDEYFAQKCVSSIKLLTATRITSPRFPKAGNILPLAVKARY